MSAKKNNDKHHNGIIASLSRFLPRIAERAKPIMNLLNKAKNFVWDEDYEEVF